MSLTQSDKLRLELTVGEMQATLVALERYRLKGGQGFLRREAEEAEMKVAAALKEVDAHDF